MHDRGLYAHIRRNRAKPVILLAFFITLHLITYGILVIFIVSAVMSTNPDFREVNLLHVMMSPENPDAYKPIIPVVIEYLRAHSMDTMKFLAVLMLFTLASFVYSLFGHMSAGRKIPGRPLSRAEAPQIYNLVQNLAIQFGLPEPDIHVVASRRMNAFAHGLTPRSATIIITERMLHDLTLQELEAVLAHEMTHIRNGDTQFMTVAQACFDISVTALLRHYAGRPWMIAKGILAGIVLLGSLFLFIPWDAAVLAAIGAFLYHLPVFFRSMIFKANEFAADAGAVEVTKNPLALVSALRKIEGLRSLPVSRSIVAAMMISGPSKGARATHPPLEERISAIVRHGGVHVDEYMRAAAFMSAAPVFGQAARPVFGQAARPVFGQAQSAAMQSMTSSPGGAAGSEEELNVWLEEVSKDRDLNRKVNKVSKDLEIIVVKTLQVGYGSIIIFILLYPFFSFLIK